MPDRLHHPGCRWERTTPAECEYRDTHHYCPHPEHACDCAEIEADRLLGEMAPEPLTVFRTRWSRRMWLPRGWVFTISLARRDDA